MEMGRDHVDHCDQFVGGRRFFPLAIPSEKKRRRVSETRSFGNNRP